MDQAIYKLCHRDTRLCLQSNAHGQLQLSDATFDRARNFTPALPAALWRLQYKRTLAGLQYTMTPYGTGPPRGARRPCLRSLRAGHMGLGACDTADTRWTLDAAPGGDRGSKGDYVLQGSSGHCFQVLDPATTPPDEVRSHPASETEFMAHEHRAGRPRLRGRSLLALTGAQHMAPRHGSCSCFFFSCR